MNSKRARDSCSMAMLIRDTLQTSARDRIYRQAGRYTDMNHTFRLLSETSYMFRRACRLGYYGAANRLLDRVNRLTGQLRQELDGLPVQPEHVQAIPTMGALAGELRQIEDEFGAWHYDRQSKLLSVRTGPIELDEVYLGPFSIELALSGLSHFAGLQAGAGQHPFRVVALDPRPASGNRHVTHPHVSDEQLCTGESAYAVSASLVEGRLADFYLIIRGLLQTYNPNSPYVPLDVWTGSTCSECGERVNEDDRYYCEACDHDVCDGCTGRCSHCDDSACLGCLSTCEHCDEYHCRACMMACAACGERCCVDCLEEDLCPPCLTTKENELEDEEDTHGGADENTDPEAAVEVATPAAPAA